MDDKERGTLKINEPHPAAPEAFAYVKGLGVEKLYRYLEAFSSCAIEGNRLGDICAETINRIIKGEPISDRYLLGLCVTLMNMEHATNDKKDAADQGEFLFERLTPTPKNE